MKKILIVDDDSQVRRAFSHALVADYLVLTAADGLEAIQVFQTTGVDLVLTDLEMPNMDGAQLAKAIKQSHPGLPIVIMTGKPDPGPNLADATVKKPGFKEILAKVRELLPA